MHILAGALLLVQIVSMWVLDASVEVEGLDFLGWTVWLVAITLLVSSIMTLRRRGQVRSGASFVATEALVTSGVYALVRHPLYLGWLLMYPAMVLFHPHWILVIAGVAGVACVFRFAVQEEACLAEAFGESYMRYTRAVPRFNLIAGAIRWLETRATRQTENPANGPK